MSLVSCSLWRNRTTIIHGTGEENGWKKRLSPASGVAVHRAVSVEQLSQAQRLSLHYSHQTYQRPLPIIEGSTDHFIHRRFPVYLHFSTHISTYKNALNNAAVDSNEWLARFSIFHLMVAYLINCCVDVDACAGEWMKRIFNCMVIAIKWIQISQQSQECFFLPDSFSICIVRFIVHAFFLNQIYEYRLYNQNWTFLYYYSLDIANQ